jgi:hypothetical protein
LYGREEQLQFLARERQWPLEFAPGNLLVEADYDLAMLRQALPVVVETAKQMALELTDPKIVEAEIASVSSKFSESIRRNVAYFSK